MPEVKKLVKILTNFKVVNFLPFYKSDIKDVKPVILSGIHNMKYVKVFRVFYEGKNT